jgi:hypothetical protein
MPKPSYFISQKTQSVGPNGEVKTGNPSSEIWSLHSGVLQKSSLLQHATVYFFVTVSYVYNDICVFLFSVQEVQESGLLGLRKRIPPGPLEGCLLNIYLQVVSN